MNQILNECHAARTARRESDESEYTRPRMLSQFRGELEENDIDDLPPRPTEAELDALEAKYRTETPAAVSELGLPVQSATWQLADGTLVSDHDPYADWEARARGEGVEALAAARAARAVGPSSPAGSLPSPVGNPDSDLGRAIDAAIREANEALAAIGAEDGDVEPPRGDPETYDAADAKSGPLPESSETDDDAATAESAAEPKAEQTTPTAEPKAESKAASGAKAAGSKYDDAKDNRGAKYDGVKAESKEAPGTDNALSPGDPAYGTLIKLLDAAQRGDHAMIAVLLREEADPTTRRRLAGSRARVGSTLMPTPLELAAAADSEQAAIECCAQILRYANASEASIAAARRVNNDAVVALLETPLPQQEDETPEPQDKPPPPKAPLTVGAAHARGRLLGRKLFRAVSNEDAAAAGRLLSAVERAPTLVRRAAIAFTDGNRWTSLHAAAAVGNAEAVSRLLAVGASTALRTATGADVVKIACDARQTQIVGVLRRHAAGVAGGRRKPRPPSPPPETAVPVPTPPPPPPPTEAAHVTEDPTTAAAPPAPKPLFTVGTRVEARFEGGDEWYAGVVEAVDGETFNVLYDDGDREIGIAAAFMRKEGSTESSADDVPATDALITDAEPVEMAPTETTPPPPPAEKTPTPPPVETAPPPTRPATGRASASNLAKACRRGDVDSVQSLLDRDAPVGETLLHDVCGLADAGAAVSIARLIIAKDKGAAARLDRVGRPPLFGAVHCPALFDLLFEAWPAGATTTDTRGFTALHSAAATGASDIVQFLVECGARIDARDDRGRVPLWHAAANGHVAVVRALCERTGRLSSAENPLEVAISRRHYEVARVLLDAGAPVGNRVVELARTGPLCKAVLARRKRDDERKRSRVAPVVATKPVLGDYTHRLNVG